MFPSRYVNPLSTGRGSNYQTKKRHKLPFAEVNATTRIQPIKDEKITRGNYKNS